MKNNLIKYIFSFLLFICYNLDIIGQSNFNFTLTSKSPHYNGPTDTILIGPCINSTTEATLSLTLDECASPLVNSNLLGDTAIISVVDTSTWQCWTPSNWNFNIKIWGNLPNPYKIKYLNNTYLIPCNPTLIQETSLIPSISIFQNIISINHYGQLQCMVTDILGRLIYKGSENGINLNDYIVLKGIYIITIFWDNKYYRQKFHIE